MALPAASDAFRPRSGHHIVAASTNPISITGPMIVVLVIVALVGGGVAVRSRRPRA